MAVIAAIEREPLFTPLMASKRGFTSWICTVFVLCAHAQPKDQEITKSPRAAFWTVRLYHILYYSYFFLSILSLHVPDFGVLCPIITLPFPNRVKYDAAPLGHHHLLCKLRRLFWRADFICDIKQLMYFVFYYNVVMNLQLIRDGNWADFAVSYLVYLDSNWPTYTRLSNLIS